jgi:hypothetical protein
MILYCKKQEENSLYFLRHVDLLLGNDREINNYTLAVTRQPPVNSNRETVFSVRSVPRCYKQDKLGVAVSGELSQPVSELEDCCDSVVVSC